MGGDAHSIGKESDDEIDRIWERKTCEKGAEL